MTKVAVIIGSLQEKSVNKLLAKNIEALAPEGVEFVHADIASLPLFNQDLEANFPQEATALKDVIESSDAVLFVTPEYNHSYTGVLKNAIDWGSRPWGSNSWAEKPTGIIGASISPNGTKFAQEALIHIIEWFKSPLYEDEKILLTVGEETFDENGVIADDLKGALKTYIDGFIDWVAHDSEA